MHASETWQLRFYQTPESRVPFRQWQASLTDPRVAAAVEVRLDRLRQGLFGDCKPVGEGVLEIRKYRRDYEQRIRAAVRSS
ncbi:MAG: hypothetical protein AABM33_15065 [Pseudomonadota bacterium]